MDICAVIVTYNRLNKLKKCLASYSQQCVKPTKMIVVDNASKEDTKAFLKEWQNVDEGITKIVLTLNQNYGGSGGFYYGMKKAVEIGFDYVWLADDDAYPKKECFQVLVDSIIMNGYEALCSSVYNGDGIAFAHRRHLIEKKHSVKELYSSIDDYQQDCFDIDLFSFVGCLLSWSVVEKCGFPNKDYFIWYDDTEYSMRVRRNTNIICCPKAKVFHDSNEVTSEFSWKWYYGFRNQLDLSKKHYSKKQFAHFLTVYKLRMVKAFVLNHYKYALLKDALHDWKNGKMGKSEKYMPK